MTPATAAAAFLTPRRERSIEPPPALPGGTSDMANGRDGPIHVQRAGQGPRVLFVHGWEGCWADLAPLMPATLAAGLAVVAPDLPAHGASGADRASIPDCAAALLQVQHLTGPFHAVVAHSIGCAVTVEALRRGLQARRVVLISTPARYLAHAQAFAARLGLDAGQTTAMIEALREQGVDVADIDGPRIVRAFDIPALLFHSADDRVVPLAEGRAVAQAWPGAVLRALDGLGHRRLLADPQVLRETLEFLTRRAAPPASS